MKKKNALKTLIIIFLLGLFIFNLQAKEKECPVEIVSTVKNVDENFDLVVKVLIRNNSTISTTNIEFVIFMNCKNRLTPVSTYVNASVKCPSHEKKEIVIYPTFTKTEKTMIGGTYKGSIAITRIRFNNGTMWSAYDEE